MDIESLAPVFKMCILNFAIESGLCFSALCQMIYICCFNELAQQFYQAGKIVHILYVRKQRWEKLKPCALPENVRGQS